MADGVLASRGFTASTATWCFYFTVSKPILNILLNLNKILHTFNLPHNKIMMGKISLIFNIKTIK